MDFIEFSKQVLQKKSFRITNSRIKVLEELKKNKKPLNPYEIYNKIKLNNKKIDVVTVYRILELYKKLGIVHETSKGYLSCKKIKCENKEHCHHQFICEKCKEGKEIHFNDGDFLKMINKKFPEISIKKHFFEFSGVCENCK